MSLMFLTSMLFDRCSYSYLLRADLFFLSALLMPFFFKIKAEEKKVKRKVILVTKSFKNNFRSPEA